MTACTYITSITSVPHRRSSRNGKAVMGKNKKALQTIKKIPIFAGVSPTQIQSILDICTSVRCESDETIYAANSPSDEMRILLSGELSVLNEEGIRLARLYPITTVGEMGLVTRQTRSASVEAAKASNMLVLKRSAFDELLRGDRDLQAKFYQNVIAILAEKTGLSQEEIGGMVDERMIPDRMRVLIVDDEPAICEVVKEALTEYDVEEASDGTEALKTVESNPPDVVITDIRMPHMDGTALLKALRNIAPNLPIIAISGYVDPEEVEDYGFDGFIKKPFQLDDFRTIVDQTTVKNTV